MTFDPDLIREFCRVYVQPFVPGRQPQFLAAVYREMYEAFAGVEMLDEIRARKRCKSNKHHQMLTDTAHNYLVSQLGRVKTLLRASQNASHFWALFYHEFQGKPVQTAIYWPN
jgi:hypothetical protein